jgi:aryl-alcohol dehydrogenase-like predicted oxidoreductase
MEKDGKSKMVYRYLGNTGMKVSLFAFGTMLVDYTEETEKNWIECADHAFKAGINFFDSAEMYGRGKGDALLGRAIKELGWRREDLVISCKMFGGMTENTNGLSRKKIIESCKNSLKHMGLEYCDIVFAHRWETDTPLEETCRAFNWLIKKGYALYWATSAWPEDLIMEAIKICDKHGWYRPIADQCEYN